MFGAVLRILARRTSSALGATKLLPVAAIWIGFAILTGLTGAPGAAGEAVAWVAHIGGFLSGLLLFGLFDRGRPSGKVRA
jgi:membrane associated rhomboid family serine protease